MISIILLIENIMKGLLRLFLVTVLSLFTLMASFAYEANERDYQAIDIIEEKLFDVIDENENDAITPEKMVMALEKYSHNRAKSERVKEILAIIIDDIQYEYYLWDYSEDDYEFSESDCVDWEFYDDEEWICYSEWEEVDMDYMDDFGDEDFEAHWWEDDWENIHATYEMSGNTIRLLNGKSDPKDQEVFTLFSTLIPENFRKDFKLYKVYFDPNGDTSAHVVQNEDNNNMWDMTVNLSTFYPDGQFDGKESVHTLIHEFSHVLTLSKKQVKYLDSGNELAYSRAEKNCVTFLVQEWCLRDGWYLQSFINQFWKEDFKKSQNGEENDFYSWKEENFVTDYASTNPWEDIAESFTYFVLKNKPTGTTVADKKTWMFYDFPELVKLRTVIRSRLEIIKK